MRKALALKTQRESLQLKRAETHLLLRAAMKSQIPSICGRWPPRDTVLRAPTALSIIRRATGGFNPLSLPGLQWLLHPDDATDLILNGTTGDMEINSIVDRKAGVTFAAPAASNRMPLNTSERPGHQVADAKTSNADFLEYGDATFAQAITGGGAGSWTLFTLHRYDALTAGSLQNIMGYLTGTGWGGGTFPNRIRMRYAAGSPGFAVVDLSDANHSTYQWGSADGFTASHITSWATWIFTYDGAGTMEMWANGVSLGAKLLTHRTPTGLGYVKFGGGASGSNFFHHGVKGACLTKLSNANIVALNEWLHASN